jgi:hypothetical protein
MKRGGAVIASALVVACTNAADNPLGGPFGGTWEPVEPVEGSALAEDASDAPSATVTSLTNGDANPADANAPFDSGDAGSSDGGIGPTWTDIYSRYLTQSTCGTGPGGAFAGLCHNKEFSSISGAYAYIQSQCPSTTMKCLKKLGACNGGQCTEGNMPVSGDLSDEGYAAIKAWMAAGAQNN